MALDVDLDASFGNIWNWEGLLEKARETYITNDGEISPNVALASLEVLVP
jgi:hypothetical protein